MIWFFLSILVVFLGTCFIVQAIESAVDKKAQLKSNAEEALRAQNKELKQQEEKYTKENEELKDAFANSQKKIGTLNAELKKAKDEIEKLSEKLSSAENTNADIIWALDGKATPQETEKKLEELVKENKSLKTQNANLKKYKKQEETEKKRKVWEKFFTKAENVLEEKYQLNTFYESVGTSRFEKAISSEVEMVNMELFAEFTPKDDAEASDNYKTTLKGCTCPDCKYNGVHVCKHMLHLAYTVGALQLKSKRFDSTKKQLIEDIKENAKTIEDQKKEIANANKRIKKLEEKEKTLISKSVAQ